VLAATRPEFDALGGVATLEAVMGSAHAAGAAPKPASLAGAWRRGTETMTLRADGTYELLDAYFIPGSSACIKGTSYAATETGTYTSDGTTMVFVPKTAVAKVKVCRGKIGGGPDTETLKLTDRRSYTVALDATSLTLTGPGCSSLKEINCETRNTLMFEPKDH
jgi:hypothetical protein